MTGKWTLDPRMTRFYAEQQLPQLLPRHVVLPAGSIERANLFLDLIQGRVGNVDTDEIIHFFMRGAPAKGGSKQLRDLLRRPATGLAVPRSEPFHHFPDHAHKHHGWHTPTMSAMGGKRSIRHGSVHAVSGLHPRDDVQQSPERFLDIAVADDIVSASRGEALKNEHRTVNAD